MLGILEKGLRGKGNVEDSQVVLEDGHGELPHHLGHYPLGSVLAKQETLVREQQLGEEKPPWEYMKEEENPQLLFQEWTSSLSA